MNNKATSVTIIVCIITTTALCFIEAIDITIVNNENETGVDNSSCLVGDIHCSALDFVFSNLSDCHNEPYNVLILGGNYSFTLNSTVTDNLFKNCLAINITGESTDSTNIVCGMDAGFAFQNVSQVKIANITFTNCGSLRNSTSVNITANSPNTTLLLSTALYFTYCKNVQIINVIVQNSNSTGVVMYNTYGELLVEGSTFIGNSNQKNSLPSNGGFYIEFVYCDPGKVDENCVQQKNSHVEYFLKSNEFLFNYAINKIEDTLFYLPYKTKYYSFGCGGGLSIVFRGNACNNTVLIDNCMFFGNTAAWGGGLLVKFEDSSKGNKIIINNTNFSENQVILLYSGNNYGTSGGGVRVEFVIYEEKSVEFNSLFFENCLFVGNKALSGGGLGMYIPYEPNVINATNSLSFKNCKWTGNIALLGSAVDLDFWHIYTAGAKMQVEFLACKFYNNENREDIDVTVNKPWSEFSSFGTGALYANGMPIVFEESVEFSNNTGSALAIYDTIAKFADGCYASFINNSAWEGGAIVMLGASQLWIYPQTEFLFKMNKAKLRGGAIYALQTSRHDLLSGGNCFLHYYDLNVSSPDEWKTKFHFENNTAPTGSSIFATTLLSCAWGASFGDLNFTLLNVLNWTHFSYIPHFNNNTVATEISKINVDVSTPTEIIPGKHTALPITTVDDKGNNINRSLWLVSNDTSVQVSSPLTDNLAIILQGIPNSKASIQIVTDGSRIIATKLPVKLAECPPGYYLDVDNNKTCQCSYLNSKQRLDGILSCDSETFTAKIRRGYWAGYHLSPNYPAPNDSNLVTGQSPKRYYHVSEQDIFLPNESNITLLNELLCSPVNRNGTLCGRCSNGYGVAINSFYFDCVKCSHQQSQHGWIIYALTEYVPSTLLFCIVLFFDVNFQSGTISSIDLYIQIIYVINIYSDRDLDLPSFSVNIYKGIDFFYNIWNLEFFGYLLAPFCIKKNFNTMDILLIKYLSAFYPFLLLLLVITLAKLVYVKCCHLEKVARYIRDDYIRCKLKIVRKGSTVNGLATVWTLIFTKLALISGLILSQGFLTGPEHSNLKLKVVWLNGNLPYGGEAHLPYMIPAVVILVFFVMIPAMGLFCYPLVPQITGLIQERTGVNFNQYRCYRLVSSALQRPFISLKPLIDCFQGSCKARHEFYASLLFIYRLLIVLAFSFTPQTGSIFYITAITLLLIVITAIFQPYKKNQDNVVTILCFSNIIFCYLFYTEAQSNHSLQPWLWLQLLMVQLPMLFFIMFMVWRSWQKLKACWFQEPLYDAIPQNENDELNIPVRAQAIDNSLEFDTNENIANDHPASPRIHSATRSIQNTKMPKDNDNISNRYPIENHGSCGYQDNTSDR